MRKSDRVRINNEKERWGRVPFAQGNKSIEIIPPTQAALAQHIKRAAYQAGHVWGQALEPMQELPSPAEWGWQQSPEGWSPKWTKLAEASKAWSELVSCGYKRVAVDYVNVLKQTSLALQCVLEQEVVTKNRMTLKLVTFIIHSIMKLF